MASQACVSGLPSKKWRALVTPVVLIGVLGYAIGNYAGVGMAFLLLAITGEARGRVTRSEGLPRVPGNQPPIKIDRATERFDADPLVRLVG